MRIICQNDHIEKCSATMMTAGRNSAARAATCRPKALRVGATRRRGRSASFSTPPSLSSRKSYSGHISQLELSLNRPLRPSKQARKVQEKLTSRPARFPATGLPCDHPRLVLGSSWSEWEWSRAPPWPVARDTKVGLFTEACRRCRRRSAARRRSWL